MRTEFPVSDAGILKLKIQILRELSASPYPREALPLLAAKHGITVDDAKALVERHGWPDAGAMGRAAEVLDGKAPAAPPPKVAGNGAATTAAVSLAAPPKPTPQANATEQMIAAAEKSAKARTRRLATKVRGDLAELRGLVIAERKEAEAAQVEAEKKARLEAEVAELELELAQKKALLRPAGVKPKRKPRTDDAKKIRAWAAENGVACAGSGRVPAEVVEAYERAHPSGEDQA